MLETALRICPFCEATCGLTLTIDERVQMIKVARDVLGPDIGVVSGLMGTSTAQAVQQAQTLTDAGADALLVFGIIEFIVAPLVLARNPKLAPAPAPSRPFQLSLRAVTSRPVWVTRALCAPVIRWSPPNVQRSVQPVTAAPLLVTVTVPRNRPGSALVR